MTDIRDEFIINAPANRIIEALISSEHIKKWWTTNASLRPVPGEIGTFQWSTYGWTVKIKLVQIENGRFVQWKCLESNMQGTDAWVGSEMNFYVEEIDQKTKLNFIQRDYKESPCKEVCTQGWKFVLGSSLKKYLETG